MIYRYGNSLKNVSQRFCKFPGFLNQVEFGGVYVIISKLSYVHKFDILGTLKETDILMNSEHSAEFEIICKCIN